MLQATLELLAEIGFDAMSIEAIATRAGVGKTTIYRRYASKEELVADAIETVREEVEQQAHRQGAPQAPHAAHRHHGHVLHRLHGGGLGGADAAGVVGEEDARHRGEGRDGAGVRVAMGRGYPPRPTPV